jgi:cell division septation protein DedD
MARWESCCAAFFAAVIISGCGSHEPVVEEPLMSPPPAEQQPPPVSIETRTDTVATIRTPAQEPQQVPPTPAVQARFKVQIGAFHDPQRATVIQNLARERFALPAINEYDAAHGTYRIRVGSFETRKEAEDFRKKMQQQFPGEYADAWIINPGTDS